MGYLYVTQLRTIQISHTNLVSGLAQDLSHSLLITNIVILGSKSTLIFRN